MSKITLASKITAFAVVGSMLGLLASISVQAETYPSRPVKIVTQAAAGSALDVLVRFVANQMAKSWPAGVVVENKPGGGSAIAAQSVIAAPKDGYTLMHAGASLYTVLPAESDRPLVDPDRDLVPVAHLGDLPLVIAVPKGHPALTLGQLIDEARKSPGKVMVGTNSAGSLPWFAASLLAEKAEAPLTIAPYARGGAPAILNDLLGDRLQATVEAITGLRGAIDSGQLRALAVMTPERLPGLSNIPTAAETVSGFNVTGWSLLVAPTGTPEPVISEIERAVRAAYSDPAVRLQLANLNVYPRNLTTSELRKLIAEEQRIWWPRVKAHAATANK